MHYSKEILFSKIGYKCKNMPLPQNKNNNMQNEGACFSLFHIGNFMSIRIFLQQEKVPKKSCIRISYHFHFSLPYLYHFIIIILLLFN